MHLGQGLDGSKITKQNFPLGELALKLKTYSDEVFSGKGFVRISGLDPAKFAKEDNVMIFLGISSHFGDQRGKQDDDGNMIVHLYHDKSAFPESGSGPTRHSNKDCSFHTDWKADVLAMQVLGQGAVGGGQYVASISTIYNKMRQSQHKLLEQLTKADWLVDSQRSSQLNERRPLLFHEDGKLIMDYSRSRILGVRGNRPEDLPHASTEQMKALAAFELAAYENKFRLPMATGDMIFINNLAIVHAREAFEDDQTNERHIARLWLRDEDRAWSIPAPLVENHRKVFGGDQTIPERWRLGPRRDIPIVWNVLMSQ
jgi:hypothetical protein